MAPRYLRGSLELWLQYLPAVVSLLRGSLWPGDPSQQPSQLSTLNSGGGGGGGGGSRRTALLMKKDDGDDDGDDDHDEEP